MTIEVVNTVSVNHQFCGRSVEFELFETAISMSVWTIINIDCGVETNVVLPQNIDKDMTSVALKQAGLRKINIETFGNENLIALPCPKRLEIVASFISVTPARLICSSKHVFTVFMAFF